MSEKHLDKLAKLLRLAEKASTEAEANAFMTKAQELSTVYSIDLEVARQRQLDKEKRETPTQRRIVMGECGKRGLANYVNLFRAIAHANGVKLNIAHNSTYVIAFGFPSDIEVVEALYSSLVHQMVFASDAYIRSGEYKNEIVTRTVRVKDDYYWGCYDYKTVTKPVDGRVARNSFMQAFITRIGSRLNEAKANVEKVMEHQTVDINGVSTGMDLVLVKREVEVADYYKTASNARGAWKGGSSKGYSSHGSAAGYRAGNSARLGTNKALA